MVGRGSIASYWPHALDRDCRKGSLLVSPKHTCASLRGDGKGAGAGAWHEGSDVCTRAYQWREMRWTADPRRRWCCQATAAAPSFSPATDFATVHETTLITVFADLPQLGVWPGPAQQEVGAGQCQRANGCGVRLPGPTTRTVGAAPRGVSGYIAEMRRYALFVFLAAANSRYLDLA